MRQALLKSCADSAQASALGALLSCVTLVFALIGTMNRMRFSSDANVQKALGLITDTWGAFCLCFTLFNFYFDCYADLPSSVEDFRIRKRWGPAWYCYLFCALSGIIRAWAHWVTPTPDHGVGCCTFRLPHAIMALLDVDGDGKLSYAEVRSRPSSESNIPYQLTWHMNRRPCRRRGTSHEPAYECPLS